MKKIYMILAAMAALTMTAQAQFMSWIEVGDFYNASATYDGSYFDMAPTNFYVGHTGAQMIYTPDLLPNMERKEGIKIKYLNFKFCNDGAYEEIVRNVKVYLREIDATEFAVNENGVKQFFEFGDQVAEGRYDIDMLECYYEDQTLSIEIENPFPFNMGHSLLVTIVFDAEDVDNCTSGSDFAPFYTSGISGRVMTYTDNWSSFVDYALGNNFPDATATLGCGTNVELPVTEIGYTYERMLGDAYVDGTINIADLTTIVDYILGNNPDNFSWENADVYQDGTVNIADVTTVVDIILGIE